MRELLVGVMMVALCTPMVAQARGGGGGGQMRQGQGQPAGYGQRMGGAANASQPRVQNPQQDRYRECTQATSRLRKTLRKMSRLQTGTALSADQTRRYREQLRQQLQLLLQEHNDWLNTFTAEQTTEAQPEITNAASEVQTLQDLAGIMDLELGEELVNTEKVRVDAAKAEAAVQQVEQEQNKLEEKIQSAGKGE